MSRSVRVTGGDLERRIIDDGSVLLLPIRRPHADRIFEGSKHFELRKVLPRAMPRRVYLYEVGGRGVVGSFEVAEIFSSAPDELWGKVGHAATTHQRFWAYFAGRNWGSAVQIENPIRFPEPISLKQLRKVIPEIHAPQGYLVLPGESAAARILEQLRQHAIARMPPSVTLRSIAPSEHQHYVSLVTEHVGNYYDDIDDGFALANLRIHDLGFDPSGFFTTSKEVLTILDASGTVVGFTTLTFKAGGSVKSGPTVLFAEHRGKGFGIATRRAIVRHARQRGMRKVYCTAADTAKTTIEYLLGSGMRIEAHLERHYARDHGELVFGQMIVADEIPPKRDYSTSNRKGRVVATRRLAAAKLIHLFEKAFERTWSALSRSRVEAIIRLALERNAKGHERKPRMLVCAATKTGVCVGLIVLVPKRGGAVKAVLLRDTGHADTLRELVAAAIQRAAALRARKLFFVHPAQDNHAIQLLRDLQFQIEGALRAPYVAGQDVFVLSRFI